MRTKYLYIAVIFFLGLSASAQEISFPGQGPFDGLQSSLDKFLDDAGQNNESLKQMYDEFIRLVLLMNDICMTMNAKFEKYEVGNRALGYYTSERTGDLYAEFDWQNLATSMRVDSSKSATGVFFGGSHMGNKRSEEEFTMYIDSLGFWYVPYEDQYGGNGYLLVNLRDKMQNMAKQLEFSIEVAIEFKVSQALSLFAQTALDKIDYEHFNPEYTNYLPTLYLLGKGQGEKALKLYLDDLKKLQFEKISNIPPLIHFAFIFSPTLTRSKFEVQEDTVTWRGQDNCIKMTVLSGNDAGYQIVFDRYGRLIHLRDTDDATADYRYDKDVTVKLPSNPVSFTNFKREP